MPTLQEILRDPNYVNANPATKKAIFERWAPSDQNYSSANQATQAAIRQRFGVGMVEAPVEEPAKPEESGFLRQAADVPLSVGKGALTGVRLIADAFGAGSKASEAIKGAEGYLSGLMSAQAKGDEQEIVRIMKDAEDKGALEQVKAGLKAFTVAPVDLISQGLGTAAPAVLGLLGGKVLGAGALGARAIGAGIGAAMGAGTAKGGIYEATKEELTKAGLPEDQAEKRAQEAQAYGGKNLDQILLSTGLGAFASSTGLESATRRILLRSGVKEAAKQEAADVAKRGIVQTGKKLTKGAAAEGVPEFIQAGQEQVAQNIALQREGFDVPTFRGAVGAGTLEALAGAGLGAGFGALESTQGGLREKAQRDAADILEQERIAAGEEPPRVEPTQAPAEVSDIEELERQYGMAPPSIEPEAAAETTDPAAPPAVTPAVEPVAAEVQPEAEATLENETPQQRLDRLRSKRIGMMNAFRDNVITNREYEAFQAELAAAEEQAKGAPTDVSQLSEAKQEVLRMADEIEAAGNKSFADGMRLNAKPESREPTAQTMEFYRSKLPQKPKAEEVGAAAEQVTYGLPEFFASTPKDADRIAGLRKSGPPKVRMALDEINDTMQTLMDTITNAGYKMENVIPGQVPPAILRIKSQIGLLASDASRISRSAEAIQKGYKRADKKRLDADIKGALDGINEAEDLIAFDRNVPTAAEEMEGVAVPPSPEVQDLMDEQKKAAQDIARLKNRGMSLWTALAGKLSKEEVRGLGGRSMQVGKNQFLNLGAKRGKPSTELADLVADGMLNPFLPPNMRNDAAQFDNTESTEYIRNRLASGQYTTYDTDVAIEQIGQEALELERRIQEELSLEEINREIQLANEEQREADQAVADFAAEGEAGAAAQRQAEEATELDDLERRAADAGIDVDAIREEVYYDTRGEEDINYERTLADRLRGALSVQEQFLAMQTEEELKAKQEADAAAEKARKAEEKAKEEKAKADEAAADFVLTGSDREADEAAARGQQDIFAAAEEEAPQVDVNEILTPENEEAKKAYMAASKEGDATAEYRFHRALQVANEQGATLNVWSKDGRLVTQQFMQPKPENARLVTTIYPQQVLESSEKGQTGYSPDPEDQRIEKELTGKTMLQAADWAVQNAPNGFSKVIAEKVRNRLRELQRKGVELEFKVEGGNTRSARMSGARGLTIANWGEKELGTKTKFSVTLNGAAVLENQAGYPPGTRYTTLLHELIHVATMGQLQFTPFSDPIRKQLRELSNAIVARFNEDAKAGKLPPVMQKYYKRENNVLRDDDEVMAWGLTDGEVQKYYADIKVGEKSAMSKLVDLVRQILGLGKPYESALDRLVTVSESLLDADIDTIEAVLGKSGRTLGEAKAAPAKGEQQSLFEQEGGAPKGRQNILGETVLGTWTEPTDTKMAGELGKDDIIYWLQDKMVDTKRVVQAITAKAGKIATQWNPYLQEELYHGRTAKETKDFLKDELRPLMQEMQKDGVTIGELEQYLHNRHAEAYNAQVAKVNPNDPEMQDGGSGITNEDARNYLDSLPEDKRKVYEKLAKRVDSITKGTRSLLVKSGLESKDTIGAWEAAFPGYVPLHREDVDFQYTTSSTGTGQGFDVRGPFSRRAMGSKRKVVDILANIAMQRERAIVKSNKNRVAQAVYGLAVQNPNPDFWLAVNPAAEKVPESAIEEMRALGIDEDAVKFLMKEPRQRAVDPKKNEVIARINATLRNNDSVLSMRLNGENRYVFFNPNNERSARAAQALKNLDADQLSQVMGMLAKVTRWFASVNTQYNPIFGAYNFLRDVQGAALQLSTTPLAGKQKEVTKNVLPALRAIYTSMRKERKGEKVDNEMAKLWDDFQKAGGQTGFRDMFSRSQERAEALQKEFAQMSDGRLKSAGRATLDWLSDYNDTMENAVRLAAYKVALDEGKNKDEAASIAKNLTVNFNKKGQVATQAGALYAFFNAAVQGTTRLVQTLRGPAGKKIMAGGLLLGVMQAAMFAAAGFDEEEPPEFVRERNIVIPTGWLTGKDDYIMFPMPLGYHVIPGFSRIVTEWALSGFKDTPDRVASLTGMFLEAFNPIGNAGWSVQSIAPTFADPLVALAENKDWTGKPIARKDFSSLDPTPGYTRAKDSASWVSTQISKFLNYASGGTKYQPGIISPTPDQIDFLIGQATGGLGRELLKVEQTITKTATGEELPPYKIPVVGRFYGETKSSAAESARFYKNMEQINKLENEIKGRRENKEPLGDFLRENPEARLASRAREIYSDIKKLRERREKLVERDAPRESVKAVETQITNKMRLLNEQVDRLKK